jgi:N-acetylmuramoyl-L-alanine amidase
VHFIVGIKGEIVQCVPTEEMAYHAGAKKYTTEALGRLGHYPNNRTIGIELYHPTGDGYFRPGTVPVTVELCALPCVQSGLDPLGDIWRHYDITGKLCPKWFVDDPDQFNDFKESITVALVRMRDLELTPNNQ